MEKDLQKLAEAGWGVGLPVTRSLHRVPFDSFLFTEKDIERHDDEVEIIENTFDLAAAENRDVYAVMVCDLDYVHKNEKTRYFLAGYGFDGVGEIVTNFADVKNGIDYSVDASRKHLITFTYGQNYSSFRKPEGVDGADPIKFWDCNRSVFVFHKLEPSLAEKVVAAWEEANTVSEAESFICEAFWDKDRVVSDAPLIDSVRKEISKLSVGLEPLVRNGVEASKDDREDSAVCKPEAER